MDFSEWKKKNTGKSINDYYKENPPRITKNNNLRDNSIIEPKINTNNTNEKLSQTNSLKINITSIIFSLLIIISFFIPWFEINVFNYSINTNGYKLPSYIKLLGLIESPIILKSNLIIPIVSFLTIIAEVNKSWLRSLFQLIVISTIYFWIYKLWSIIQAISLESANYGFDIELTQYFSIGLYLTIIGTIYYLYDAINSFISYK